MREMPVSIPAGEVWLAGDLVLPQAGEGLVVFAHGSGSSRFSPRNRQVAAALQRRRLGTLLFDLLTAREEELDLRTAELRFDVDRLADRLVAALDWISSIPAVHRLRLGTFGSSTGAAAALIAAAARPHLVHAVVSRGGRPDLAEDALPHVRVPTLLIVGGEDPVVVDLNRQALGRMAADARIEIVPGATHLFEEPGALEQVCRLAGDFFVSHLAARESHAPR